MTLNTIALAKKTKIAAVNMLANPGFESGQFDPWNLVSSKGSIETNSDNSIYGYNGAYRFMSAGAGYPITQTFTVAVGASFHTEMMAFSAASGRTVTVKCTFDDGSTSTLYSATPSANKWVRIFGDVTAPAGASTMIFSVESNSYMRFDDMLLCTAADWQALQSLGISYFDGSGVYTSSVSDLACSWTGTANASTSTLSQGGQVVATNLVTDPNALQQLSKWWYPTSGSVDVVQQSDGHWAYNLSSDLTKFVIFLPNITLDTDDYVYWEWTGGTGDGYLQRMDTVAKGNGWIVGKNTDSTGNRGLCPEFNGNTITILKVGIYSAADYAAMQARGVDWFDGDSDFSQGQADIVSGWTGTPNASPSTLSQGGQVVATNFAEDPAITQTLTAFNGGGTWVRSPDVTAPTGSSWTYTAQKSDWQWLGPLYLMGVKGLVSNPHPGENMHVLLYAGTTINGVKLEVKTYDGTSWTSQPNYLSIALGHMSWSEATFTMPTDPSVEVMLHSFYVIAATGTVNIGAVMLLTDTDYQAMQALGVDWFDGDSNTSRHLSQRLIDSDWTGAQDASQSILLDSKSKRIINLLYTPKLKASQLTAQDAKLTIANDGDQVTLTSNGSTNPYAKTDDILLPPGSYHLHAKMSGATGSTWPSFAIGFASGMQIKNTDIIYGIADLDVTLTKGIDDGLMLACPSDGKARWSEVGIYSSEDWAVLQSAGLSYFDGDTNTLV